MAIRNVLKMGDPILNKKSKQVVDFNDRLHTLLGDMADTMYKEDGVGLAAPQVGEVTRPNYVRIKAQDRYGKEIELEGHGFLARAFCHELDHLEGILFVEKVEETEKGE